MSRPTDKTTLVPNLNKTESSHALDQGQELLDSVINRTPVHVRVSSPENSMLKRSIDAQHEVRRHSKRLTLTSVGGSSSQPGMTLPGSVAMSPTSIGEKDPQEHPSGRGWTENVNPLSKIIGRYSKQLFKKRSVAMSPTSIGEKDPQEHPSGRGWTENVSPLSKIIGRYSRRLFKKRSVGMSQTSMDKGNTPRHLSGSPTKMGIARSLVSVNSSHSQAVVISRKENSPAQSPLLAWKSAESFSGAGTSLDEGHQRKAKDASDEDAAQAAIVVYVLSDFDFTIPAHELTKLSL